MAETGGQLIAKCSMEGKPVWTNQLRALAAGPEQVAELVKQAERWGVQVNGKLNYSESKALYGI